MSNKLKNNDLIIVISGKNKGKCGKIKKIFNNKVIIKNLNFVKKHQKAIPYMNQKACILKKEAPIHISNISILNKYTKKPDKICYERKFKKKIRLYKSNKKNIN